MAAFNYQWSSEGMTQPGVARIFGQLTTQLAELEWKIDTIGNQLVQNDYYQQPSYTPNYYHSNWQNQPYQQSEKYSNLEEILSKFMMSTEQFREDTVTRMQQHEKMMSQMEMNMKNNSVALQNLKNQVEQIASALNNRPQDNLPSNSDVNSRKEGKEKFNPVIIQIVEKLNEMVVRNLKRSHLDGEDDNHTDKKRIKICPQEKNVTFKIFKEIKIPIDYEAGYQIHMFKDKIKVDEDDDSYFLPMDEDKFGGNFQLNEHALQFKEKTTRRHAKIIFAIEPD